MSTLSVCIIAKNESEVIGRCLACVMNFADEIIVVDTGSSDNTKYIASTYTDKVYDFPWDDDFSEARNFSFSKATMDYIMWIDCDDVIDDENQKKIIKFKEMLPGTADTYMADYYISPELTTTVIRIVKRGTSRWIGFVHEYLETSPNKIRVDFMVTHMKTVNSSIRDNGRNLRIFERKEAKRVKLESRDVLYYAKELYWNGRYADAIKKIREYFCMDGKWLEDEIQISIIEGACFGKLGDSSAKIDVLSSAIIKYGMNNRLLYDCGLELYYNSRYSEAAMYFSAILSGFGFDSAYFSDKFEFVFNSLILESCCLWYLGKKDAGKRLHEKAKSIHPDNEAILSNEKFFS